jgi:hypothetical protein
MSFAALFANKGIQVNSDIGRGLLGPAHIDQFPKTLVRVFHIDSLILELGLGEWLGNLRFQPREPHACARFLERALLIRPQRSPHETVRSSRFVPLGKSALRCQKLAACAICSPF